MPMLALGTGAGAEAASAQPSARMRSMRSSRSITWADEEDERPVSCRRCEVQRASVSRTRALSRDGHCGVASGRGFSGCQQYGTHDSRLHHIAMLLRMHASLVAGGERGVFRLWLRIRQVGQGWQQSAVCLRCGNQGAGAGRAQSEARRRQAQREATEQRSRQRPPLTCGSHRAVAAPRARTQVRL